MTREPTGVAFTKRVARLLQEHDFHYEEEARIGGLYLDFAVYGPDPQQFVVLETKAETRGRELDEGSY